MNLIYFLKYAVYYGIFFWKPFLLMFHICSTSFSEVIRSDRNTCLIACEQQSKSNHTCMYIKWDKRVFSQFIDHQDLLPSWFGRFYSFRVSSFSALQTQVFQLNLESILPNFAFTRFPILVVKLECF